MTSKTQSTITPTSGAFNQWIFTLLAVLTLLTVICGEVVQQSALTNLTIRAGKASSYSSNWKGTRRWVGPEWWANPMYDWTMKKGSVISQAASDRTLCLLSHEMNTIGASFQTQVTVKLMRKSGSKDLHHTVSTGFRFARRGNNFDYRSSVIEPWRSIDAVIDHAGALMLGNRRSEETFSFSKGPITLLMNGKRVGRIVEITLSGKQGSRMTRIMESFPIDSIRGGMSLLANGPKKSYDGSPPVSVSFKSFSLSGSLISSFPGRTFGPIMWSQYALSDGTLKIQCQIAPLDKNISVELLMKGSGSSNVRRMTRPMERFSRTVSFTIPNWNGVKSQSYVLEMVWEGKMYKWRGTIRKEPSRLQKVKVGCFSCDNGYLFPNPTLVGQVTKQDPDLLFFAGDQIYENMGMFPAVYEPRNIAMLDFLFKYYRFGWMWRHLLRNRPSVIITDDHDVYQGNIWGHGGRSLPNPKARDWREGGYLMSGDWVSAVEKIHVGHLPEAAVKMTLPIGIKPYFTSLNYGGIGFAVLEDRKFKTGPLSLPLSKQDDGDGASLLGPAQERFLTTWAKNWTSHSMKVALSQTIFCAASTHTGPELKRGLFIQDKGAWPKAARNRAVKILGDANVFSIHGDQHLGILLRQGVDKYNDAGYAFMVPGTANGWPRAWWPGVKGTAPMGNVKFTGRFIDDAGHPLQIIGVGNPEPLSNRLKPSTNGWDHIGYAKGSGYGMVQFDKRTKTALVNLYRLGSTGEQFDGFPKSIRIGGNPGK